jgi:WD40 repeat protein
MEFVYAHRKALEGQFVSERLNYWIDLIWGVKQRGKEAELSFNLFKPELYDDYDFGRNPPAEVGCVPHQLFFTPHPRRLWNCWKSAPLTHRIRIRLPVGPLLYTSLKFEEMFSYHLLCVERNGDVSRWRVNLGAVDSHKPDETFIGLSRVSIPQFEEFAKDLDSTNFFYFRTTLAIVDCNRCSVPLTDVTNGSQTIVACHRSDVTCISAQGGWMVTAGKDGILGVFSVTNLKSPVYRIPLYRDEVTCCAINSEFGLIASGTRDGFLILSSPTRGSHVRVIDLGGCRPYAVMITESWAFVVVCTTKLEHGMVKHSMSVYNANGIFIRTKVLPEPMIAFVTWSSLAGFDFVMIASDSAKFYYSEAFYLDFSIIKGCKTSAQVIGLSYSPKQPGVLVAYDNADLLLIPFSQEL